MKIVRRIGFIVIATAATLLCTLALTFNWAYSQAFDTSQFVSTADTIYQDPSVQQEIAQTLVASLVGDTELPAVITKPLTTMTTELVSSETFHTFWVTAVEKIHQPLMKQLQSDPWDAVEKAYPLESIHKGRVTNITDYGAFVELEAGVEGLVHVSEMSWTKKNVHPGKIVSTSQEVEVVVLDVDPSKRRVSLGLKQAMPNPWEQFIETHPVGSTVEGEVKNATEFGLFIGLENDIDGMVHLSDIDWTAAGEEAIQRYKKGDVVKAKVLDVDVEKERISLGIKQLAGDPMAGDTHRKGQTVTVIVTDVTTGGLEVKFGDENAPMTAFIRKSDLSRDRSEQRPERFAVNDRLDAQITNIDKAARRVSLSVKALEMAEEKEAIEQFGSSDSGASLGDILGAALREKASKE